MWHPTGEAKRPVRSLLGVRKLPQRLPLQGGAPEIADPLFATESSGDCAYSRPAGHLGVQVRRELGTASSGGRGPYGAFTLCARVRETGVRRSHSSAAATVPARPCPGASRLRLAMRCGVHCGIGRAIGWREASDRRLGLRACPCRSADPVGDGTPPASAPSTPSLTWPHWRQQRHPRSPGVDVESRCDFVHGWLASPRCCTLQDRIWEAERRAHHGQLDQVGMRDRGPRNTSVLRSFSQGPSDEYRRVRVL